MRRLAVSCEGLKNVICAVHVGPQEGRVEPEEARDLIPGGRIGVRRPARGADRGRSGPERAILIGQSNKRRVLLVVFIEKSEDTIRIISARRATSHERKRYEEGEW